MPMPMPMPRHRHRHRAALGRRQLALTANVSLAARVLVIFDRHFFITHRADHFRQAFPLATVNFPVRSAFALGAVVQFPFAACVVAQIVARFAFLFFNARAV